MGAAGAGDAGHRLVKTRAQFHRMFGKKVSWPRTSSTESPSDAARIRLRRKFRHTTHTFRGPIGAPPKAPVAPPACVRTTHADTPLTRFVAP